MMAPELSRTEPRIVPVGSCANNEAAAVSEHAVTINSTKDLGSFAFLNHVRRAIPNLHHQLRYCVACLYVLLWTESRVGYGAGFAMSRTTGLINARSAGHIDTQDRKAYKRGNTWEIS